MPTRRDAIAATLLAAAPWPARAAGDAVVRVWATTDRSVAQPLLDDFERQHAGWLVHFVQLGSAELHERFLAGGGHGVDVLWSSAMDLQTQLVNDGHAARYESPHAASLPRWAVWKHEAYGSTFEPVGWAYHRKLLGADEVPRDHGALAALLDAQRTRFRQRVATYDVERAGLGYMIAAHDAMSWPRSWELWRVLGRCQPQLHEDSLGMLHGLASGRTLIAHNVLGPYAEAFARREPDIAVLYPDDYTLVLTRVAFIARHAPNPRGARLWLDHLLSVRGQQALAEGGGLYAVRSDAAPARSAAALEQRLGPAARPVVLGPGLLAHLAPSRRRSFLKRWTQAVRPGL